MTGQRPLASIRVLEIGTSIAGPYCTAILAAFGAEVTKLEPPGRGDDTRRWGPPFWNGESVTYLSVNAGKRSLALDLKDPVGVSVARRVATSSDVIVQNLRPGLVADIGLDFETLAKLNDRIVYCSIGSFGTVGPLASEPGYDPLMQAAAGIMSITGESERPPVRTGPSIVDQGAGLWAAIAILAALRTRDAGGGGPQHVETSLFETAIAWLPYQIAGFLATGQPPGAYGSGISILAPYEAFLTRDGWVMIAAGNDRIFSRLCSALSLAGLADDPRFATNANRVANRESLVRILAATLAERRASDVVATLRAARVPVTPVRDIAEAAQADQTEALGIIRSLPSASNPELQLVSTPVSIGGERMTWDSAPPELGAHSIEILREVGVESEDVDALISRGSLEQST
jgi:crotonobetainyl-CoA:carnitine CoA-transferase CaiB-like acyl-CoA transferase